MCYCRSSCFVIYADFSIPFQLHMDASLVGLNTVLCQRRDGELHVIAYVSCSLKHPETNYFAYKGEFLALYWAILTIHIVLSSRCGLRVGL